MALSVAKTTQRLR